MKKLIEIVRQFLGLGATAKAITTASQLNNEIKEAVVEVEQKVEEVKKKVSQEWIKPGHRNGQNTHNVSATVSIKEDEWELVGEWMWKNRKFYNGLSVLPYNGGTYTQAPFEDCTKEDYERLVNTLKDVDLTRVIESQDNTDLRGEVACAGGACEIV